MTHPLKTQDAMPQSTETLVAPLHSPLELLRQLHTCLSDLDRLGETVAAAHLSACIDVFGKRFIVEADASKTD